MNTEFKGTRGKWEIEQRKDYPSLHWIKSRKKQTPYIIASTSFAPHSEANAELIADAGNTIQSCGLLPSQLLKQNQQMKSFLNKINNDYEAFSDLNSHGYGEELEKLIESTNP